MRLAPFLLLLATAVGVASFQAATVSPPPVYRVVSGSMAPRLPGPHVSVTCAHCQFTVMVDGTLELPTKLTCPNCGQTSSAPPTVVEPGSTIQWEPVAPEELRRYDLIVLEVPQQKPALVVKRIAFLPGEVPRIDQGELYQNGEILRKTPRQREAAKLLVYDQSHQAGDFRFLSQLASGSGWDIRPGVLAYAPLHQDEPGAEDWLIYHHRSCLPPPSSLDQATPPQDSYAYNHSLSRELFPANDLWLEWTFRHWNAAALVLRLQGEGEEACIRLDFAKKLVQAQSSLGSVELPLEIESLTGVTVRGGQYDGRLFLELDQGKRHWSFPLVATKLALSAKPLALRIEGGTAVLKKAKVYRDIVWLGGHRRTAAWSWERKLGLHEIFVLGDNVPVSEDSRGEMGPIDIRKHLRGKVLQATPN